MDTTLIPSEDSGDLISKYGAQTVVAADHMGLAPTIIHGAVAAVADFGATVWNSLPLTENVATEDLLTRIDSSALDVYNEHPDAVHAASFIGGSFLPIGLAMKGMTAARAGVKGVNWFSKAGATARMAEVETAFGNAGAASEALNAAQFSIYKAAAANALVDSVAAEAAIAITMNAHPYMEDYNKDFASNFAFWSLVGAGVGGAVGLIGERALVRNLTSSMQTNTAKTINEGLAEVSSALPARDQLRIVADNIDKNEAKLALAKDATKPEYTLNAYTMDMLSFHIQTQKAILIDATEAMAKGELKDAPKEVRQFVTDWLIKDSRTIGADSVEFFSPLKNLVTPAEAKLAEAPTFSQKIKKFVLGEEKVVEEFNKAAYVPHANGGAGGFTDIAGASQFTTVADAVAGSSSAIDKVAKLVQPSFMNEDAFLHSIKLSTAEVDLQFAATFKRFSEMNLAELNTARIAETDLATLMAATTRALSLDITEGAKVAVLVGANKLSAVELLAATQEAFLKSVNTLVKEGAAPETIALRTGAPVETVQKILAKQEISASDIFKYKTVEDITTAIAQEKRVLSIAVNPRKVANAENAANQNLSFSHNYNNSLTDMYLASAKSDISKDIFTHFGSEDFRTRMDVMLGGIDKVTSTGIRSMFVSTLNFSLEKFGIAGNIAIQMGKDNILLRNKFADKYIKPIADKGALLIKNEAALVEHNMALNFEASLKDFHLFDQKTGEFLLKQKNLETGVTEMIPAMKDGKVFTIMNADVRSIFASYQEMGREMYEMINVPNKVLGKAPVNDRGFWVPAFNPRDKQIAYVYNSTIDSISLLHAKTPAELNDAVALLRRRLEAEGDKVTKVFTKGVEQEIFNKLAGRHDPMYMGVADATMLHSGASAATVVKTNAEPLTELINGFDHALSRGVTNILELKMQPVMDRLKVISDLSKIGYEEGTLGLVGKHIKKPIDPGQIMRNTIIGKPNLGEYQAWQQWQQTGQVFTDIALQKISDTFASVLNPVKGKLFGAASNVRDEASWTKMNKDLADAGLTPYSHVDDYVRYLKEGTSHPENITPRLIALSNGMAATILLRFMEIAQPFVNMVSLPILTSGALTRKLEASFMDGVLDPNAKFHLAATMHDGIRLLNHPIEGAKWSKLAEEKHLFKAIVSEASETLREIHSVGGGNISAMENALHSKFMNIMAAPADFSETLVRKSTFFTGVAIAKKAYPGLSDTGVMTFARDFMDEAIGNYTAAQRPVAFQGTFGVAMGLFQTYMVTLAQHMYRQVEHKDWAALGKMMLTQSTIFGASSLPGFQPISEAIGTHMSDNHIDLETGTFRAIPDPAATMLLYGLPSSFGPGITTRGDIKPRVPNPMKGLTDIPTINLGKQAYDASERLVKAAFSADKNTGRAMLEALSLQSVSRPIARMSELASGTAVTGAGEKVAGDAEIYTTLGVAARLMATRPIEEIKSRQALHLNSLYGGIDAKKRREITGKLKTAIRDGDLDPEKVQELQYEYMRTGTVGGWRSAVNGALMEKNKTGAANVKSNLRPDAVYQIMIDDRE